MSIKLDPAKSGQAVSWIAPPHVPLDVLRNGLVLAGFSTDLVRDMAPRNAFSRAARELSKARVIRKTREDEHRVYFQFTKEYLDSTHGGNPQFDYTKECELSVHKDTGSVLAESGGITGFDLAREAGELLVRHQCTRLKGDVTAIVQKIFKAHGGLIVRMRDEGGIYFVPDLYKAITDQVETFLKHVGGKVKRFTIYMGDPETIESVNDVMTDHFSEMIATLQESINELGEKSSDEMLANRLAKIQSLRVMMEANVVLMGDKIDKVQDALVDAERSMMNHLIGISGSSADSGRELAACS